MHLAWWGILITILAAPIDDLWHRLFGLDVTLRSPPHLAPAPQNDPKVRKTAQVSTTTTPGMLPPVR